VRPFASKVALAIVATGAAASLTLGAQQTPPRSAPGADAVRIDVEVSRQGRPVEGLTAADFSVRDAGVSQTLDLIPTDRVPVNLLLALDASASMRGPALDQLKEAATGALAALRPADQAAVLTFSHNITLHTDWTSNRDRLDKAIAGIVAQGFTALADAAFVSLAYRTTPDARTLVVFFSDGDDTASWLSFADLVPSAQRSDAVVCGVMLTGPGHTGAMLTGMMGAGRERASAETRARIERWFTDEPSLYRGALLPRLALETGGEVVQVADMGKLRAAFTDIISRFHQRYVVSFTPTGVAGSGWHPLEVSVTGGGDLTARRGYSR
jgi:VWFA-related protein